MTFARYLSTVELSTRVTHTVIYTFAAIQSIAEAPHYYIWSLLAFNFSRPGDEI